MIRMSKRPLEGVRVIDSSYVFAGPYATGLLGDLGAEVIKVEGPTRPDFTRGGAFSGLLPENEPRDDPWNRMSAYNLVNRGKKSLVVDLTKPQGREVFIDLIKASDVIVENFTPRVMRGWGLDYPNMMKINPGIIMISNTGYGRGGPYSDYPAQATTQEATHGLAAVTGYAGGEPSKAGQSYVDFLAAWTIATAALLGLRYRRRFGRGLWADIGMYQLGCYNVSEFVLDQVANGARGERIGNRHRQYAPQGCYRCAGKDQWCAISVRDDEQWRALCGVIGQAALAADPRFATAAGRHTHHDAIDDIITQWTATVSKIEAMQRLQAAGVPAGAVLDGRDLHFDPQLQSRGLVEMVDYPPQRGMGPRRPLLGRPWKFSAAPLSIKGPAPAYGEHNREVLRGVLGYDETRCEALYGAGIIVDKPVKPRDFPMMSMDKRVEIGRLAYWDADYRARLGILE
ncbi:MAG: CoA transferase [Betaproteobacteria bacterium]|nr:CoA transferase [Betaproteobacteria bacterium]